MESLFSFPVGLLHPLQHAGLSRRSPSCRPFVQVIVCVVVWSKSDISGLAFCDPKSIWASRR
jgi:hypothetical protein